MSMLLKFDPEGGDLGRGEKVTALEMAIIVPHIAIILQLLHQERESEKIHYKYGFELWLGEQNRLILALHDLERQFPPNVKWYEVDGKKYFELRGCSGGVTTAYVCYLVTM